MDKKLKIIIGILITLILCSPIFYNFIKDRKKDEQYSYVITNDSLNFKQEYEQLNSDTDKYLNVEIPSYVPIEYVDYDKIFEILDNGTGIIYFGFPECPWCRNLTPVLASSAIDYGIDTIYYFNKHEDRNSLSLNKKGKIVTDKKGTKEYNKLIDLLKEVLPVYRGLNDDSIKRLYFPTVLFVKEGKVLGLEQTLSTYAERIDGDPLIPMSKAEKDELSNIFKNYYKQIKPKKN
ncbi:MAG: hypothetical protein PHF21_01900 [Bacilli bacterium]|nr:hypothetical protein [Bacilli bacterium]